MIIATNEYPTNVPGNKKASHGGTARFARDLSNVFTEAGHEWIGILNKRGKGSEQKIELVKRYRKKTFWRHTYPRDTFNKVTWAKRKTSPEKLLAKEITSVKKIFDKEQPDILFLNGFSIYNWILLRAAYEAGIPIVTQHAGLLKKEIQTYKDYFSPIGRRLLIGMERDITKLGDHEIFLNRFSLREYERILIKVPRSKRSVIPLPIPIQMNTVVKKKSKDDKKHIGIVARWDRIKNYPAFLSVAQEAKKMNKPWVFHAVTRIPDTPINKEMKKRFRDTIEVHGLMPTKRLTKFYRAMDLMLLPSNFDVSPHVVLEAACQKTGTIISKNVGWADVYRSTGNSKWIADFSKPKAVVQKIESLMSKTLNAKFIGDIKREHDPKRVHKAYLNLLESLV